MTHLHLMLNHVPVLGIAFGLALMGVALLRKSEDLKKAALATFILSALISVPVYFTGEPAEDTVKALPGVSSPIMERHEGAAGVAFGGAIAIGIIAMAGLLLFRRQKPVPSWFGSLLLLCAIVVTGLMAWTANLGGQIRHSEIRSTASASHTSSEKHHD